MTIHWHAPPPPATTASICGSRPCRCRRPEPGLARPAGVPLAAGAKTPCLPPRSPARPSAWCRSPSSDPPCGFASFTLSRAHGARPRPTADETAVPSPERAPHSPAAAQSHTRIKPPGDVIKLADRLHYVLQPSLESLLAEGSLAFPFRPFPVPVRGHRLSLSAAGRRSWPTRWGWAKPCRPSPPSACCSTAARCAACCWFAPSRW